MRIINANNLEWLRDTKERFDCIIADPPDNLGLDYEQYKDRLHDAEYTSLLGAWTYAFTRAAPIVWISFYTKWVPAMGAIVENFLALNRDWEFKECVQTFTFGQYNPNDLGNNHRPLWRLRHRDAPLFPNQIKVESWRQKHGDKRAAAGGRVPGDVFVPDPIGCICRCKKGMLGNVLSCRDGVYHGINIETGGAWQSKDPEIVTRLNGDVFDFTRVTGNSKQRRAWHPTQLNEGLYERCIKLSTLVGGSVLDPFGGTGTLLRVCKQIKRRATVVELDSTYCERMREEHGS